MNQEDFNKIVQNHEMFRPIGARRLQIEKRASVIEMSWFSRIKGTPLYQKLIHMNEDPTTVMFRHIPDDFCTIPEKTFSTFIDWKTPKYKRTPSAGQNIPNLAIDSVEIVGAWPYVQNDCRVLFCYCDPYYKTEKGFYLDKSFIPNVVMLPKRYGKDINPKHVELTKQTFPDAKYVSIEKRDGSGNPFMLWMGNEVEDMPHWLDLIP